MSDHDPNEGVEGDDVLAARLTDVLTGRATSLIIGDRPFDPARPMYLADVEPATLAPSPNGARIEPVVETLTLVDVDVLGTVDVGTAPGRARRWVPWVAGVAAAAVLLVALVLVNGADRSTVVLDGTEPAPGPDTVWVPTRAPDGLELWEVMVGRLGTPWTTTLPPSEEPTVQLLAEGEAEIFLLIGESAVLPDNFEQTATTTVRGAPATVREATSPGDGVPLPTPSFEVSGQPIGTELAWSEGGQLVSATIKGMTWQDAVGLLDSLEVRDPADVPAGFDAPAGSSVRLVGEQLHGIPSARMGAWFVFGSAPPSPADVPELIVQAASSGGRTGYLRAAFAGTIEADGRATNLIPRTQMLAGPAFETVWPDGRSVTIFSADVGSGDTVATVLGGMEADDLDGAVALKQEVSDRLAAGPVIASADVPSGRIDLIGDPTATAVCLTTPDGLRTCGSRFPISTSFDQEVVTGTIQRGDVWTVFVASQAPIELTAHDDDRPVDEGSGSDPTRLPTAPELATDGSWYLGLLIAPAGADRVDVDTGNRGWGFTPMAV